VIPLTKDKKEKETEKNFGNVGDVVKTPEEHSNSSSNEKVTTTTTTNTTSQ
jgi:hypothetical protein